MKKFNAREFAIYGVYLSLEILYLKYPFTLGYDITTPSKRLNFNSSVEQWVNTYLAFVNFHYVDIQGLFFKIAPPSERIACIGGPKIYSNHK